MLSGMGEVGHNAENRPSSSILAGIFILWINLGVWISTPNELQHPPCMADSGGRGGHVGILVDKFCTRKGICRTETGVHLLLENIIFSPYFAVALF